MSRAKRTSHLALVLMFLATGLLVPGIIQPDEAEAKNGVDVNQSTKTITITVNVNVIGANAPDVISAWIDAFNKTWGDPGGFPYSCWTVVLKLEILPGFEIRPGEHTVFIVETRPGQLPSSETGRPRNYKPDQDSVKGYWQHPPRTDGTIPHEFGHVFGMPDEYLKFTDKADKQYSVPDPTKAPEYTWKDNGDGVFDVKDVWNDKNNDGLVDRGEVTPPTLKPGETPSMMASSKHGKLLSRHIESLVKKHVDPDKLKCEWRGTFDHESSGTTGVAFSTGRLQVTLSVEEAEDGSLTGTAEAVGTMEFTGNIGCPLPIVEPLNAQLKVTGQRTDEAMELHFSSDTSLVVTWTTPPCGTAPELTHPLNPWEGVIANWSQTPLPRHGDGYGLEHAGPTPTGQQSLTILIEPADDEGEPVG